MNYFEPVTKYFIIDILANSNGHIELGNTNLSSYIKENFPILDALRQERLDMLNSGIRKDSTEYREYRKFVRVVLGYLNIPPYILARGNNSTLAVEPVTNTKVFSSNDDLEARRVSDVELGEYYISDYERKVKNFFNPTVIIRERAELTKEEIVDEIKKIVVNRRRQAAKKLQKERKI